MGDEPFQKACTQIGICGGGCKVIYISPDSERVYTFIKYADLHPPQTAIEYFPEKEQEFVKKWFIAGDPSWPGRSRVCCFEKNTDDEWVSRSSTLQVQVKISMDNAL